MGHTHLWPKPKAEPHGKELAVTVRQRVGILIAGVDQVSQFCLLFFLNYWIFNMYCSSWQKRIHHSKSFLLPTNWIGAVKQWNGVITSKWHHHLDMVFISDRSWLERIIVLSFQRHSPYLFVEVSVGFDFQLIPDSFTSYSCCCDTEIYIIILYTTQYLPQIKEWGINCDMHKNEYEFVNEL